MKRILYLSFYFEPDLCAGSFRNTPLAKELSAQLGDGAEIVVITSQPNRYNTFKIEAPVFEKQGNMQIHRIHIPGHSSGFTDQILAFKTYYKQARKIAEDQHFDLVFASSSRLFTAYLGHRISCRIGVPLYLDIRDIFTDIMADIIKNPFVKTLVLPILNRIEKATFSRAAHINLISEGFKPYFHKYRTPSYSYYSNGIDDEFVNLPESTAPADEIKTIVYAGNIGEGQGLHIIIPQAAKRLGGRFQFTIVGDGGAKNRLADELHKNGVNNVTLLNPMKRTELLALYRQSDFFFIHLNDYEAFKKVLPSKIFELAAYDKPVIAGVSGYASRFISDNVENVILFEPGDVNAFVSQLEHYKYKLQKRQSFIDKFRRSRLNKEMAASIISYLR